MPTLTPLPTLSTGITTPANTSNINQTVDKINTGLKTLTPPTPPAPVTPTPPAPTPSPVVATPPVTPAVSATPTTPATTATTDQTNKINTATTNLTQAQTDYQNQATQVQNSITGIQNGTIPLTAGEQAQVDGLNQSYQQLITQQQLANTNANGIANIRGYQTGAAEYDPTFQAKTIGAIVTGGIQKLADLNTKMAGAVATLTQSLKNNDIANVKDAWSVYQNASKERTDALQKTIDDTNKAISDANATLEQQKKDYFTEVTQPIQNIATEAAKNGADPKTIAAINSAGSVTDAINAAGGSLQTATGQLGDYLQYKKDAQASGLVPEDYSTWKAADDAKTNKEKENLAYGTAFATASGKAAGEARATGTTPSSAVTSPLGIVYNAPASIAPYVYFASNGVKYVDLSGFKGTPTEANQAAGDAQAAGYKVITNKQTANDVQNISDAMAKLDDMKTAFDQVTSGSAAERNTYAAAFETMAQKLQTDPKVTGINVYQDTALDILKAMSGVQGFRGGASMVENVKNTFPAITDTTQAADAKISTIKQLIGDREKALVGTPSASEQLLVTAKQNENNITNNLTSIKTSNPKLFTAASNMFTSVNPDTGQPYTASDILQAFPELNK